MDATTQQTWQGKTAGGWLKSATIMRMAAGSVEIMIGRDIALLDDDDNLAITDESGVVARLATSARAARRLRHMHAECNWMGVVA